MAALTANTITNASNAAANAAQARLKAYEGMTMGYDDLHAAMLDIVVVATDAYSAVLKARLNDPTLLGDLLTILRIV